MPPLSDGARDQDDDDIIIGFRQDRIGARLICLLNTIRLSKKFNIKGRFIWLSEPDGPYPELVDPRDFLVDNFVQQHIAIRGRAPDRSGRKNINALAPSISSAHFAEMLARGERFECDSMSEIVRFMDESPTDVAREVRSIASGLPLSALLEDALIDARKRVSAFGGGQPIAIHMRRGDLMDGDPWSYSGWPSKFVPDEFFRAFIAENDGPVIAFSDTPEAIAHMKDGNPRVVAVNELLENKGLRPAEQDLLELILMAGCSKVGAPIMSAFSRAAELVGGCKIVALPPHLGNPGRILAYDALVDRVIGAPDSFYRPGDLAQSISYAVNHAVNTGRARPVVRSVSDNDALLERFPFLYADLARAALAADMLGRARKLAQGGLASPNLRNRDRPVCEQILMMASAKAGSHIETTEMTSRFLTMSFRGREGDGQIAAELGHQLCHGETAASRALMYDPLIAQIYQRVERVPDNRNHHDVKDMMTLPVWTWRVDWSELITSQSVSRELVQYPSLENKLAPMMAEFSEVESAIGHGRALNDVSDDVLSKMGFAAAVLRLHGRYKRSFALLEWIDVLRPNHALTHKRMADTYFASNNAKEGQRWLDSALTLSPDNPLLHLSAAARAVSQQKRPLVRSHLEQAKALLPELSLAQSIWKRLGKGKSKQD